MSRELKFRVWNGSQFINTGKDCYVITPNDGKLNRVLFDEGGLLPYENAIIEQFTGLRDRNGKEIYENDLMRAVGKNTADDTLSVVFKNGAFCLKLGKESEPFFNDDYDINFTLSHLEVIGNIHENGDLLK